MSLTMIPLVCVARRSFSLRYLTFGVPAHGAETFHGGGSRLLWQCPALDIRLSLHLDVDAQFFFNVQQDAFAPKQGAQPRLENVEPFHHQPPQTAFLTFAMARASRSQLSSSAVSCLLPAFVSV